MRKILVSWSIAYDYIMDFDWDLWKNVNIRDDWKLSSYLLINNLEKETGWTGLNIAFNLAMLWENAILLWSIWEDFVFDSFVKDKLDLTYVYKSRDLLSASAYIINDSRWWIINSFYPWALMDADKISVFDVKEEISYFMVSPDKKEAMLRHLEEAKSKSIKTFFDPGQMLNSFSREELIAWSKNANYLITNEQEFQDFLKKSGLDEVELLNYYEKIIVTLWSKWSKIIDKSWVIHIWAIKVDEVVDPTWAWDAYRWGLLIWLKYWFDFEVSAKIWSVVSSYCLWFRWWQNHFVNKSLVEEDMKNHFWIEIDLA